MRLTSGRQIRELLIGAILLLTGTALWAESDLHRLVDLSGTWKFELGDDLRRAEPDFDDSNWDSITVPGRWEDQGYPGYDGFAWYRRHFTVPNNVNEKVLYLKMGTIDDADEIFINGHSVGFYGTFPPHYSTAYNVWRQYHVASKYLNPGGDNVIAVRVYDDQLEGGIIHGEQGLYEDRGALWAQYSLEGTWKFTEGDDMRWKDPAFDDQAWQNITVPAYWENQGHRDYDGYGWYRLRFRVPESLASQRLILLLGKIDDYDEAYLNGERVGHTGSMPEFPKKGKTDQHSYAELRVYTLAPDVLRPNAENVLAVRVYDGYMQGGIYDGPVGFIERSRYLSWRNTRRDDRKGWDRFFDFFAK